MGNLQSYDGYADIPTIIEATGGTEARVTNGVGGRGRGPGRGVRHVGVAAPDPGPLRQPRLLLAKLLRGHRLRVRDSLLLVVAVVPRVLKCSKFLVVNSNHCNLEELITIDVTFHFAPL